MKFFLEFVANGKRRRIEVASLAEVLTMTRELVDCHPKLVMFEDEVTSTEFVLRRKKNR